MEYKDSTDTNNEDLDLNSELPISDSDLDFQEGESFDEDEVNLNELEQLARKAKNQNNASRFSLKARRAIEDHAELRKLRKEVDYFFDDDFAEPEEGSEK